MPSKKKPPAGPPPIPPGFVPLDYDTADEDFYQFLEEIGPQISTVDIFRLNPNGSRPQVSRVTMDAINEDVYEYLRTLDANGGKYLLQFKSADRMIKRTKTIEVAGRQQQSNTNAPAAAATEHVQILREQIAQQQTLILTLVASMAQAGKGPDLGFLAGVLKPPDITPMVTLMTAMLGRKETGLNGLELAKDIVALSRDLAPDGGPKEESWLSVAKDVGGKLIETIGQAAAVPLPAPPVRAAIPAQVTPAPPDVNGGNMRVTPANFQDWLRAALVFFKQKILKGQDMELLAEWVLDNADDEPMFAAVVGVITQQGAGDKKETLFNQLLQFDAEIAQNPQLLAGFTKLYADLHAEIHNNVDPARPGGNADDAGGNAPAGAGSPPTPGDFEASR